MVGSSLYESRVASNSTWLRVYDPIFVVSTLLMVVYMKVLRELLKNNPRILLAILSVFCVVTTGT